VPGFLSLGINWPRREADHLPSSSIEAKNAWNCTFDPQYVFMAYCLINVGYVFLTCYLVKHKDTSHYAILNFFYSYQRFEVFSAVKFQVEVFCVVTPSNVVVGNQRFGGPCCFHLQGEFNTEGV
jgi:hypothetical protein